MKDRIDWVNPFKITQELCRKGEKSPCSKQTTEIIGPLSVQNGELFHKFAEVWREKDSPLISKKDQLQESFWDAGFGHLMENIWERPHIKHTVMAYGVDVPTEIGFYYHKREELDGETQNKSEITDEETDEETESYDGMPLLKQVIWEDANGVLIEESYRVNEASSSVFKRKPKKETLSKRSQLPHSGDGTIPYLSLSWAHTWLLHTARAYKRMPLTEDWFSEIDKDFNAKDILRNVKISHRPKGGSDWFSGPQTSQECKGIDEECEEKDDKMHPHGTKYKPEMLR